MTHSHKVADILNAASRGAALRRGDARNDNDLSNHLDGELPGGERNGVSDGLLGAIEGEVIPRLLLAHQAALQTQKSRLSERTSEAVDMLIRGQDEQASPSPVILASDVQAFADLLVKFDGPVARRFVDAQISRGHSVPDLLLDLCAPTARELGLRWANDTCSFCDVTIAMSSLEQVIMHCSGSANSLPKRPNHDRTILLSPMPGNQHVFGLLIVKELFGRAGWVVRGPATPDAQALLEAVSKTRFSAVGLSVGDANGLCECADLIKALRVESLNPRIMVVVGGYGIQEANMSTRQLGADLIARDGREGLDQIERFIGHFEAQAPLN